MLKYKNIFLYFFFTYIAIFVLTVQNYNYFIKITGKILPVAYLIYLIHIIFDNKNKETALLILALFFSIVGDIFMVFDKYFIYGILAFICAHIAYISLFYSNINKPKAYRFLFLTPIIICSSYVYWYLQAYINNKLALYIDIYILILSTMAFTSVLTMQKYNLILLGGMFFIMADALLAYNQFIYQLPIQHIISLCCYYFAQLLLVQGRILMVTKY